MGRRPMTSHARIVAEIGYEVSSNFPLSTDNIRFGEAKKRRGCAGDLQFSPNLDPGAPARRCALTR